MWDAEGPDGHSESGAGLRLEQPQAWGCSECSGGTRQADRANRCKHSLKKGDARSACCADARLPHCQHALFALSFAQHQLGTNSKVLFVHARYSRSQHQEQAPAVPTLAVCLHLVGYT